MRLPESSSPSQTTTKIGSEEHNKPAIFILTSLLHFRHALEAISQKKGPAQSAGP